MAQTAEAIGAVTQADPNSVGAKPTEAALTEASRVVHPESAPKGETGGAPGSAPGPDGDGAAAGDWKSTLPPDVAKRVDQVITELRQKDGDHVRELEAKTQRLAWADDLNRMVASENPVDRQRAVALLQATISTLEKYTPAGEKAPDPMAGVNWENLEAIAPGISKVFQHLNTQNAQFAEMLGKTHEVAEGTAYKAAEADFARELSDLEGWAKSKNLPFDAQKVIDTENRLGIADLKSAYFATYGQDLIGAGQKAADESLSRRKAASLPGGTAGGGAPSRPKFTSMHEQWEWLKREKGITGPIEYKG
jgi:hypothetical protein